jgi:hypothetical protein
MCIRIDFSVKVTNDLSKCDVPYLAFEIYVQGSAYNIRVSVRLSQSLIDGCLNQFTSRCKVIVCAKW